MARTPARKTGKAKATTKRGRATPAAKARARRYTATPSGTNDRQHLIGLIRTTTSCTEQAAREALNGVLGTIAETTLDPAKRTLLQVNIESELEADVTFVTLLGKDPALRYRFIMDSAGLADDLDI